MGQKEYNYEYEEEKLLRSTESDIELSNEMVVSKSLVNTVKYYYDADDKMTKKAITPASGSVQTIYYENSEDNTVVKFNAGGKTITAHSKTDSFGRKVFDELQLGTGFVSRQFHYHAGVATEEHVDNNMLKSSPTTQLVSQIVLSGGRTISYEYDEEERITKVDDSVDGITTYTYDALGQLLTETVNGTVANTMTYDNYGNIVSKNGVAYTYGDEHWHDLLTAYDGQSIVYDKQGNPTSYLGHTLTWENVRQGTVLCLKENRIDNIGYEDYNACYDNEMRYIGKGPVGYYELLSEITDVAKRLQDSGFVKNKFGKSIPIIIHDLEYTWYIIEATKKLTQMEKQTYFSQL